MLFSVVTVCLNAQDTIGRCIDSVAGQITREGEPFVDFEHVVVDGASADGTLEIIRAHTGAGHSPRLLSQRDAGIYHAMNKGIGLASGEYVVFVNADDWLEVEALSIVAGILESRSGAALTAPDVVGGSVQIHGRDGSTRLLPPDPGQNERRYPLKMSSGHQATFMRAALLRDLDGFRTQFKLAADYDLFLRAIASGATWAFTDETLAHFSLGGASFALVATARDYRLARAANGFPFVYVWLQYLRNVVGSALARMRS